MEYGNPPRVLLRVAIVGALLGTIAWSAILIAYHFTGSQIDRPLQLLAILLSAPLVLVLGVLPTVAFHIRLNGDRVQHVVLGTYIISDYPIADFQEIRLAERGCAAVLYFRDSKKIHFFGAHVGEVARLSKDLRSAHKKKIA